jgi:uncharacterized protein YacL (UPF0231 family)
MAMAKELFDEWLEDEVKIKLSELEQLLQSVHQAVNRP